MNDDSAVKVSFASKVTSSSKKLTINAKNEPSSFDMPKKSPIISKKSFFYNRNPTNTVSSKSPNVPGAVMFRSPLKGLQRKVSLRCGSTEIENLRDSRYKLGGL